MFKFEDLTKKVIGCAMTVHRTLEPGLLESAYEECLCLELAKNSLPFQRQLPVTTEYGASKICDTYRADVVVVVVVVVDDTLLLE